MLHLVHDDLICAMNMSKYMIFLYVCTLSQSALSILVSKDLTDLIRNG